MKRIVVGVDARPLTSPTSGVARVIAQTIRHFPDRDRFRFRLYASAPAHPDFAELTASPLVEWVQGGGPLASRAGLWFNAALPLELHRRPVDVFWGSQQVTPPFLPRALPVVLTFYDLVLEFFPETMRRLARLQQRAVIRMSIKRADRIYSISEQTNRDMQRIYGFPAGRAAAALLGYEPPPNLSPLVRREIRRELARRLGFALDRNFILAVSTIEPRKNYEVLLKGWQSYRQRLKKKALPLVIVGRRGWERPEFYAELDGAIARTGQLHVLQGLSDRLVEELYRSAAMFCIPSRYEGFGLSLLEALCFGLPALASDLPCFHEIAGKKARYHSPDDVQSWTASLTEETLAQRKHGFKPVKFRAERWSWERTAAIYRDAFTELTS
ncbi:MAG: glycosyltransferase family 4 protein [Leptospirales bacterium]|nr:glycosyltransferase family 4 protein [Leptospirales bacterium]